MPGTQSATSGPPIIAVNDNPAEISVGDVYADLGAQITGTAAGKNLGITTLLDGATTTQITLDTSKPGTHTIVYSVTDPQGLRGSRLRTPRLFF